jgi:hypothetical protein
VKGSAQWNELVALWDNGIRYLSFDGLLGYFRDKGSVKGTKGGVESKVRFVTKSLVDAAELVHRKGLAVWLSSTFNSMSYPSRQDKLSEILKGGLTKEELSAVGAIAALTPAEATVKAM